MKLPNLKKNKIYLFVIVACIMIIALHLMRTREGMEESDTSRYFSTRYSKRTRGFIYFKI